MLHNSESPRFDAGLTQNEPPLQVLCALSVRCFRVNLRAIASPRLSSPHHLRAKPPPRVDVAIDVVDDLALAMARNA